jgi:hypothetical protein
MTEDAGALILASASPLARRRKIRENNRGSGTSVSTRKLVYIVEPAARLATKAWDPQQLRSWAERVLSGQNYNILPGRSQQVLLSSHSRRGLYKQTHQ